MLGYLISQKNIRQKDYCQSKRQKP